MHEIESLHFEGAARLNVCIYLKKRTVLTSGRDQTVATDEYTARVAEEY